LLNEFCPAPGQHLGGIEGRSSLTADQSEQLVIERLNFSLL
jgi:hypothetical protein